MDKSRRLDGFLKQAKRDLMPITDGEPLLSISDLVAEVRAAKNEFRANMQRQLRGMAADIRANGQIAVKKVADERRSVRDEFAQMVGNEIVDTSEDTKSDGQAGS